MANDQEPSDERRKSNETVSFGRLHISVVFLIPFVVAGLVTFLAYRDRLHDTHLSALADDVVSATAQCDRIGDRLVRIETDLATLRQRAIDHAHEAPPKEWRTAVRKNTEGRLQAFTPNQNDTFHSRVNQRFSSLEAKLQKLEGRFDTLLRWYDLGKDTRK